MRKYKVIKQPIAFGGRREVGEVVEMTDEQARAFGPEYVEEVKPSEPKEEEKKELNNPVSEPVTTGESSETEEVKISEAKEEEKVADTGESVRSQLPAQAGKKKGKK